MKIIDNALNDSLLISIKERIESKSSMPWYFIEDSAAAPTQFHSNLLNYSFYHLVFSDNEIFSSAAERTHSVGLILKDLFELEKTYNVYGLRWGMTTTLNKIHRHAPHTDYPFDHKVILFYLNDSDGDTYFYDNEHKIIDSVTPKENRAVLFDGSILHSSSKPIKFARRIVLSIDFMNKQNEKDI